MKGSIVLLSATLLLLLSCRPTTPPAAQADWIFTGGQVVTMDEEFSTAEALAVKDGRILAVGTEAEVGAFKGPDTEAVDLSGRTVIPGLQDAHIHFLSLGHDITYEAELTFAMTAEEIVAEIAALKERMDPETGEWLIGNRWDQYKYPEMVTRWQLDEVAPENPVRLNRVYRGVAVNTLVFEMMGIRDEDPSTWPDWWLEDPADLTFEDKIFRAPRSLTINGQTHPERPDGTPAHRTPPIPSKPTSKAFAWGPWRCSHWVSPASWTRPPAWATTCKSTRRR
jgi:hypothetical protein